MELIHFKHNDSTQCGFCPPVYKSSTHMTEITCWDCFDSLFKDFKFLESSKISKTQRVSYLDVFFEDQKVSSLNCFRPSSFMPMIMDVWVHKDFRNRGLATVMMKKMMYKIGPPIQLKADPFLSCEEDSKGLAETDLKNFYSKLGFTDLKSGKMMLWYPEVVKSPIRKIRVVEEGNDYIASVYDHPEIKSVTDNYYLSIGNLIHNDSSFFSVEFVK